jgi:hypothetical protein
MSRVISNAKYCTPNRKILDIREPVIYSVSRGGGGGIPRRSIQSRRRLPRDFRKRPQKCNDLLTILVPDIKREAAVRGFTHLPFFILAVLPSYGGVNQSTPGFIPASWNLEDKLHSSMRFLTTLTLIYIHSLIILVINNFYWLPMPMVY